MKRWRIAMGKLIFPKETVGPAIQHVRSIMKFVEGRKKTTKTRATGEAEQGLIWWKEVLTRTNEMSLIDREVSASMATDASNTGAAYSLELDGVGLQNRIRVQEEAHKCERARNTTRVLERMWKFTQKKTGNLVLRQCGEVRWETTKEVFDLLNQKDIKMMGRYIPGTLNRAANALSRPLQKEEEWAEALRKVTNKWGY